MSVVSSKVDELVINSLIEGKDPFQYLVDAGVSINIERAKKLVSRSGLRLKRMRDDELREREEAAEDRWRFSEQREKESLERLRKEGMGEERPKTPKFYNKEEYKDLVAKLTKVGRKKWMCKECRGSIKTGAKHVVSFGNRFHIKCFKIDFDRRNKKKFERYEASLDKWDSLNKKEV